MTNEVSNTAPAIPAFLQAHLQANKPSADVASLATAQNSTPRLSLRGKVFRFMEGQDEVYKSREPVDVFIVGVEPGPGLFTKTFYAKPYGGADSAGEPPDCSSADGQRPDPWLQQPVHTDCKSCPKNQFGSATSRKGRPSKACHDSKRLYITRAADQNGPKGVLYLSQVPVSSLRALADYGKVIQDMGCEPWMVKTQLSMDDDSEFPELGFKVNGFIDETNMATMKERATKREWANSRNLMLQNQPNRPALPAHLQNVLNGGAAAAPAAAANVAPSNVIDGSVQVVGTPNGMQAASVDPAALAAAQAAVQAAGGPAPSSEDVLAKW